MFKSRGLLGASILVIRTVLGAIVFPSSNDLPQGVDYDFIVVGGKSSTLSMINELTEPYL